MQSALFNRKWKVTAGSVSASELRVQFHIMKTVEKEPNTCDLIITNLSDTSRGQLKDQSMPVIVEAGYDGNSAVIFSGQSRICDHKPLGAEWLTKLQCGDGETNYQQATITKSFGAGYSVEQAINDIAGAMSINLGNLSAALAAGGLSLRTFDDGWAVHGNAATALDRLLKSFGYDWSIQQGALMVVQRNKEAVQEVVVLSAKTGLLGSPEHSPPTKTKKQTTLVAKSLLNSKIRPGVIVRMDSANVKGDFTPKKVEHTGDSHGPMWQTNFEAVAI